jgi:carboxymethylenebutenolidase
MCFEFDSSPPELPRDLILRPIAGGAGAETLTLTSDDGTEFSAAFADSPGSSGPALVILPDVRGLYPFYVELAERFAEAGHPAIAIDLYGRTAGLGPRGDDFDYGPHREQVKLGQAIDDVRAAIEQLKLKTGATSIATLGFCFGGSLSFVCARNADLEVIGAVGFYGVLKAERFEGRGPLAQPQETRHPVLGLFGGADQAIPADEVEAFDAALDEAGVEHEIHVYPGAPHSFFDKRQDEYASESEDAWRRVIRWLAALPQAVKQTESEDS